MLCVDWMIILSNVNDSNVETKARSRREEKNRRRRNLEERKNEGNKTKRKQIPLIVRSFVGTLEHQFFPWLFCLPACLSLSLSLSLSRKELVVVDFLSATSSLHTVEKDKKRIIIFINKKNSGHVFCWLSTFLIMAQLCGKEINVIDFSFEKSKTNELFAFFVFFYLFRFLFSSSSCVYRCRSQCNIETID
jgi:hypothetical protein